MKRLFREPLVHFLLLGVAIVAAYSLVSKRGNDVPGKVVVTVGQVEHLATGFAKTWQRPPADAELKGLIDDWVRDEIAMREAIALGLDKDDIVIRRRLRQKLEFVSDDIAAQTEPTNADLNAYLQAHPESFRVEPRFAFSQVHLNPAKHGDNLARDIAQMLAQLQQAGNKPDVSALGDSFLLEPTFQSMPAGDVAKQFGEQFAWGDADTRKPGKDGKLPAVGNTVDGANATWANTIGDPELIAVWKDPDFDPSLKAFYYVRVMEIPTPRRTAYDAKRYGITDMPNNVKMTLQERAYTSPIWYTP